MTYNRGITNERESKTSAQRNKYTQNQRVQSLYPQKEQFYENGYESTYESTYEPTYEETRPEPEKHDVLYEPFVHYRVVSRLAFGPQGGTR